jgi:hypothetical protein
MATARDAQAGWNIYRASGYSLELAEINQKLAASGFNPVAPRSYSHYRKLHRYGYQRYVPINQLDVETLRDPVWGGPLQSRFRPRPAQRQVQLFVIVDDKLVALTGELLQLSDVEGSVEVDLTASPLETSPAAIEGSHALVILADKSRAAIVELVQPAPSNASLVTISFLFLGFVPTVEVTGATGLGVSHATFKISTQEQNSPLIALRALYSLFEAIDSARVVCDQVLETLGIADSFTFPPARLNRLSMSSPLIADVSLGGSPLIVLVGIIGYFEYLRRKHYEANITRGQAKILGAQASILEEHARTLRHQNDRTELGSYLDIKKLISFIVDAVGRALPQEHETRASTLTPDMLERVTELAEKQLLPDLEKLFDAPTESVEVETEDETPSLLDDDTPEEQEDEEDNGV